MVSFIHCARVLLVTSLAVATTTYKRASAAGKYQCGDRELTSAETADVISIAVISDDGKIDPNKPDRLSSSTQEQEREPFFREMVRRYAIIKWVGIGVITVTGVAQWLYLCRQIAASGPP